MRKFDLKIIVKFFLIFILIISGITKIINPDKTINLLFNLPLIPRGLILPIVSLFPVIEIVLGFLLLLNIYQKITCVCIFFLFLGFLCISIYGTFLGINIDCGCFGDLVKSRVGWKMIVRNGVFFVMAVYIYWKNNK